MRYTLRSLAPDTPFIEALRIDLFAHLLPTARIRHAVAAAIQPQQRMRRLSHVAIVWLVIAMSLWSHLSIEHVFQKLVRGLRFLWADPTLRWPTRGALCYRRYQLGVKPFVTLFQQHCRPLASAATPGAFLFGYRLMAIDGSVETVPDTPRNAAFFGRMAGSRGACAFPQVRAVYLVECGTHAVVDAGFWPCTVHERIGGYRMLRTLQPDMLVMWDRGFHSYPMVARTCARGAQILGRLSLTANPRVRHPLADGTTLIDLAPSNHGRTPTTGIIPMRMISYRLTDPALGDPRMVHRLITTLLDPVAYPAKTLVWAYHERWEIELVIDELDTHQRVVGHPLRSQHPLGVLQELYGLVIAHYLVRTVMHEAAGADGLDPDRVSFVHALRLIQDAIPESQMVDPACLPQLYERLLTDITARLLPIRRLRRYPRLVKQKMTKFLRKPPDLPPLPQPTTPFLHAIMVVDEARTPVLINESSRRSFRNQPTPSVDVDTT